MSGQIVVTRAIQSIDFALVPGPLTPDYYRPVQSVPWGVFNIPYFGVMFSETEECHIEQDPFDNDQYYEVCGPVPHYQGLSPIDYIFNPALDITLTSHTTSFTNCSLTPAMAAPFPRYDLSQLRYYDPTFNPSFECAGIELTYRIDHPTKNSDQEIQIDKLYKIGTLAVP